MNKQKSHAFGKDVYFLGVDKDGYNLWLEAASWDCDWYWGFGYIETYSNNGDPSKARGISSHSNFDSMLLKESKFLLSDIGVESPLTKKEQWRLADLMKSFYTLKEAAAVFGRGGSHIAGTSDYLKQPEMVEKINKELLPELFKEVYKLLGE